MCEKQIEEDEEASKLTLVPSEHLRSSKQTRRDSLIFRISVHSQLPYTYLLTAKLRNKISGCYTTLALYMDLQCKNQYALSQSGDSLHLCVGFSFGFRLQWG